MNKKLKDGERYARWDRNHSTIIESIRSLILRRQRLPTNGEIARETGLSETTVSKHLKGFDWGEDVAKLRSLTASILLANAGKAIAGKPKNVELHMLYVEGVSRRKASAGISRQGESEERRVIIYLPDNGRDKNEEAE